MGISLANKLANRTFMLVFFEETSGLPFECARPGSIDLCGHSFIVLLTFVKVSRLHFDFRNWCLAGWAGAGGT